MLQDSRGDKNCSLTLTAGAVLPAIHDRTEGVPDRWRSCLERSSIWRYVCSVAGRLWTELEDRTVSPLLQCCL